MSRRLPAKELLKRNLISFGNGAGMVVGPCK
jgi:hypothetical protein